MTRRHQRAASAMERSMASSSERPFLPKPFHSCLAMLPEYPSGPSHAVLINAGSELCQLTSRTVQTLDDMPEWPQKAERPAAARLSRASAA